MSSKLPDKEWVKTLKVGDAVHVWEINKFVYSDTVTRITPTGRIVLSKGDTFWPQGWIYKASGSAYCSRRLERPS